MTKPKPKSQLQKRGRKSAYRPEYSGLAEQYCKGGMTDLEVADMFGVSGVTVWAWKTRFPEFLRAFQSGKAVADDRVERSLFHRAVGYSFEAEEVFQYQGKIVRAKVRKHVPPDTASMIFWLKNRRKDQWRDVQRHEHGGPGAFSDLTDEELARDMLRVSQQLIEGGKVIDHDEGDQE
jgi:hypothetical protein